jgi:threonine dehydrogenase-like Zn-dependent dehydrogenase
MRVPVLRGPQKLEWEERQRPAIGPDEALVKVEYCGVCGSDAHAYHSAIVMPVGTVMGHEFSGVVAEAGERVRNCRAGDRVVIRPLLDPENISGTRKPILQVTQLLETAIGISPRYDGAFAEYVRIPFPDEMIFPLPPGVSLMEAALAEPLAVSLHGVRISRIRPGARTLVIGAGMIGLGVVQFLRSGGAGKIVVIETAPEKAAIAERLGADAVLNPLAEGEEALREKIMQIMDGLGADIVFECSGAPAALQGSIRLIRRGGQLIVVGLHEHPVPFDFFWMLHLEAEIKGSFAYGRDEFQYVLEFLGKGRLVTEPLITDVIPLADLEEKGLKRVLSSRNIVKILVKPEHEGGGRK